MVHTLTRVYVHLQTTKCTQCTPLLTLHPNFYKKKTRYLARFF